MNIPTLFIPHALSKAPIITESRLIRDLTMPQRAWDKLDTPAYHRIKARSVELREFSKERRK